VTAPVIRNVSLDKDIFKTVHLLQEELALDPSDPLYRTFNKIFQAFKISEPVPEPVVEEKEEVKTT
jgi:hypothetical protein